MLMSFCLGFLEDIAGIFPSKLCEFFDEYAKVFRKAADKHIESFKQKEQANMHIEGKEESDMRIEAYTQVQQLYQSQKVNRSQKTGAVAQTDKLQISSIGKDIQVAKAAVSASPDIREELTAPIKAKIQNGTYEVSNASFAEKLLSKYEEMR